VEPLLGAQAEWIAQQQGCSIEQAAACCADLEIELRAVVHRHIRAVLGFAEQDPARFEVYRYRTWRCISHHWARLGVSAPVRYAKVIETIEQTPAGTRSANLLLDVVLAQALEFGENRAAQQFDNEYMPLVRAVAWRTAGQRGVDAMENFAAALILPRHQAPPRISQYLGRTSLAAWLRAVVANQCVSLLRSTSKASREACLEVIDPVAKEATADPTPCEQLLSPVFRQTLAALSAADRLLIKLLVLDHAPQKEVARSLGLHSGNVTRRRQKIVESIWDGVQEQVAQLRSKTPMWECLHEVLAGDNPNLRRALGNVLACALRNENPIHDEEVAP
jgi:RNA polymerase sigma factor (sigma-70 family)